MSVFTDSFEKIAQFQKQGLEPVRNFSGNAVDVFETVARKNYAILGDVLEFTVEQAKLPTTVVEPRELFERQVASTRAFVELLTERANEYVEIGKSFQASAQDVLKTDFVETVAKAADGENVKAA